MVVTRLLRPGQLILMLLTVGFRVIGHLTLLRASGARAIRPAGSPRGATGTRVPTRQPWRAYALGGRISPPGPLRVLGLTARGCLPAPALGDLCPAVKLRPSLRSVHVPLGGRRLHPIAAASATTVTAGLPDLEPSRSPSRRRSPARGERMRIPRPVATGDGIMVTCAGSPGDRKARARADLLRLTLTPANSAQRTLATFRKPPRSALAALIASGEPITTTRPPLASAVSVSPKARKSCTRADSTSSL
jgi:hypothetical protein